VQINGNIVKNPINMGTEFTLNQINAKRINEITGVDLMVTNIGFKKALNELFIPAKIPNPVPRINEKVKPISPRKIVMPTTHKKFSLRISLKVEINVDSGEGRINSEL
jgi:hypothetical protein